MTPLYVGLVLVVGARLFLRESRHLFLPYSPSTAAIQWGEVDLAEQLFSAYLSLKHDPVDLPRPHFYLAECALARGDEATAREQLRLAAESGVEVLYTNEARRRLAALTPSA